MNWLTHKRYNLIETIGIAVFTTSVHMGNIAYGFINLFAFILLSFALEQVAKK